MTNARDEAEVVEGVDEEDGARTRRVVRTEREVVEVEVEVTNRVLMFRQQLLLPPALNVSR